jgi:hypothetical protein
VRLARFVSVATGPMILYGCATQPVGVETLGTRGHLATRPGRPGLVVAAPHGTSDVRTGEIAADLARRTGFGLVVATGFSLEPGPGASPGRRYQVNRPLEGVPGRPPDEERVTEGARQVYEAYEREVRTVAQGPLDLYVEIHGNGRHESADRIEIATVGIDRDLALRLRTLFELIRDAHLRGGRGTRLEVLVEPADVLRYTASGAKRTGILRLARRALHVELPHAARHDHRDVYTAILADFLREAVALPDVRSS